MHRTASVALLFAALIPFSSAAASTCYGSAEKGRLADAVPLPDHGSNYAAYSTLGTTLGRTHVHTEVRDIVVAAYAALARDLPSTTFVYGETGWAKGGSFAPHKTHQNGTSVDFMVPVLDTSGKSVPLPTGPFNRFGYDIEFDAEGRFEGLRIDFEAIAKHLLLLDAEARKRGRSLRRVIFAPELREHLRQTGQWPQLQRQIPFSTKRPWVRHDEHYHVDFEIPCRPLGK